MQPRTLYLHSHGPPVGALQILLQRYQSNLEVDGKFGVKTESEVRLVQRKLGVFPADGMAGPHTLDALAKAVKGAQPSNPVPRPAPPAPSLGARLSAMTHQAGSVIATAQHEAVDAVEKAVQAIETWIAGLGHAPTPVPPALHLAVEPAKAKAQREPMPPGDAADPKSLSLSERGRRFIFFHEAGDGSRTARLHHPAGHSGVTLGPDMT